MANTLTALAPVLFSAAAEVQNEPFGAVDSINAMFDSKGVAIGDEVTVPVAPVRAAGDYTPAMTVVAGADATADSLKVKITKNRMVSWHLTGEQIRSLDNGASSADWARQLIAQGMRTLRNEAEADLCQTIALGASRATGTAGTTPFGSSPGLNDLVHARKILRDNGAPMADLQLVIDTAASANLFKLGIIQNAYQAGTEQERRQGIFLRQFGFMIKESAGVYSHVNGTGTGYDGVSAGSAAGSTTIALEAGTANATGIKVGDVIGFDTDPGNAYIVSQGLVAASGNIAINKPGLRAAVVDASELTIAANHACNIAFERQAVVGVLRPPLIPDNPTIQQRTISDGRGMTYLLVQAVGDGMITWRLHLAWGFAVVNPQFVARILG